MAANAFLSFFDKASGESAQKGKERWIELHSWSWEINADSSWTKGGGASVGKAAPGKLIWQHNYDTSSPVIMGYICNGRSFPKVEVQMSKTIGGGTAETYFTMLLEGAFITKVATSVTEEGSILQHVEMVFKTVKIDYKAQDPKTGRLVAATTFNWDIPAGTASPSA